MKLLHLVWRRTGSLVQIPAVATATAGGVQTVDELQCRGKSQQETMTRRDDQKEGWRESEAGGRLEAEGGGVVAGGVAWMERGVQMGGPLIHGG